MKGVVIFDELFQNKNQIMSNKRIFVTVCIVLLIQLVSASWLDFWKSKPSVDNIPTNISNKAVFQVDEKLLERMQAGQQQLQVLKSQSILLGSCWQEAIKSLETGCKPISAKDEVYEETRSRIAIMLTNCHLEKSGLKTYECAPWMHIQECTKDMITSTIAFNTYSLFTTHVDNICFYVQSDLVQKKTEVLVNQILDASSVAASTLQDVNLISHKVKSTLDQVQGDQGYLREQINEIDAKSAALSASIAKSTESLQLFGEKFGNSLDSITKNQDILETKQQELMVIGKEALDVSIEFHSILQQVKASLKDELQGISYQIVDIKSFASNSMMELSKISSEVDQKMVTNIESQDKILAVQVLLQENLLKLKTDQETAFAVAKLSLQDLASYTDETNKRIQQHNEQFLVSYNRLFNAVSRVLDLIGGILGEIWSFELVMYYACVIAISLVVTSTSYTSNARIKLLAIVGMSLIVEYCILWISAQLFAQVSVELSSTYSWSYYLIWIERKLVLVSIPIVLIVDVWNFKDYSKLAFSEVQKLDSKLDMLERNYDGVCENSGQLKHYTKKRANEKRRGELNCLLMARVPKVRLASNLIGSTEITTCVAAGPNCEIVP